MPSSTPRLSIGVVGAGAFSRHFIPLFQAHPHVRRVALAELIDERRERYARECQLEETYPDLEAMLESDLDSVAIFTQRHLHGPMTLKALEAGKHVYCAVPAASSIDEMRAIVELVEKTGLIYMTGETSYYYPSCIYCRDKAEKDEFGNFVYGEGEYIHDMSHGFYDAFKHSGGKDWKQVAGFPPMFYPTHSTSMVIATTGARLTQVSCLGFKDTENDGVFGEGKNLWDNPFSNETALFRVSNGGICRVNELRRIGHGYGNSVRTSIFGTKGCFEEQGKSYLWTTLDRQAEDISSLMACAPASPPDNLSEGEQEDFFAGTSPVHPVERVPRSFRKLRNGHYGSHHYLIDDFVRALAQQKLPPNHVWAAARYLVPGLVAHQSALEEGKTLAIPDLGSPSPTAEYIGYPPYE